jgi:transcriptional regulator with XRE-family HTH domain
MSKSVFNVDKFFNHLDSKRKDNNYTWKKVSEKSKVSASTLTRIAQGKHPDVDSLGLLCEWAKLDANEFFNTKDNVKEIDFMAQLSVNLRADKKLNKDSIEAIESTLRAAYNMFTKG